MTAVAPGVRFGRWTVIDQAPGQYHGQRLWSCRCECGTVRNVPSHSLTSGRSKSCGCLSVEANRARAEDLTGRRFGRLLVSHRLMDDIWLCKCDCGEKATVKGPYLRAGTTASCGCMKRERIAAMEAERKHGQEIHKEMHVDGTSLDAISPKRKVNKNSRTGVRGVSITPDGRYRATIVLRRVQHDLGVFDTLAQAAKVRAEAEDNLYKPILEEHGQAPKQ